MFALAHPETLSIDWLPPTLPARGLALSQALRALQPEPPAGRARLLAIEGPHGSGTSAVARQVLRQWLGRTDGRACQSGGRTLTVRVRPAHGPASVAAALLRHFDPGFVSRGFPAMEILAGCLRRVKREGGPAAILLDDIDPAAPPLGPIVRGLASPHRFLPEGDDGIPPLTVILAGQPGALQRVRRMSGLAVPRVVLAPYALSELRTIVSERIARALGRESPAGLAERIARQAHDEGRGASRALDLVRRELVGSSATRPGSVYRPVNLDPRLLVEDHLVQALAETSRSSDVRLARLRARERALAHAMGLSPLPPSTLWRRLIRLEQAGYLRREVRTGGRGGTQSRVHLLLPVAEWLTIPRAVGTPRESVPFDRGAAGGPVEAS